jgi:hypothetical protein
MDAARHVPFYIGVSAPDEFGGSGWTLTHDENS